MSQVVDIYMPIFKRTTLGADRFYCLVACTYCILAFPYLCLADTKAPFELGSQYTTNLVVTNDKGTTIVSKVFYDGGRFRVEFTENNIQCIYIAVPDQFKIYNIFPQKHSWTESIYIPGNFSLVNAVLSGSTGAAKPIGAETVDGIACYESRVTDANGKISNWWVDTKTNTPVKMVLGDGSLSFQWKDYKVGPQDPSLFELPAEYMKAGNGYLSPPKSSSQNNISQSTNGLTAPSSPTK